MKHSWRWIQLLSELNFLVGFIRFDQTKEETWSEWGAAVWLSSCLSPPRHMNTEDVLTQKHCMWLRHLCVNRSSCVITSGHFIIILCKQTKLQNYKTSQILLRIQTWLKVSTPNICICTFRKTLKKSLTFWNSKVRKTGGNRFHSAPPKLTN